MGPAVPGHHINPVLKTVPVSAPSGFQLCVYMLKFLIRGQVETLSTSHREWEELGVNGGPGASEQVNPTLFGQSGDCGHGDVRS